MKRLAALLLLLLSGALQAAPERLTSADAAEIREVIHRQIEAFRRDDAPGAFALTAPTVREAFGTPQRFLQAIRMAYRAVYRPASFAFLEPIVLGEDVVQPVQVLDRGGRMWVAYYAMQRQADGSWRTSGCHLAPPVKTYPA